MIRSWSMGLRMTFSPPPTDRRTYLTTLILRRNELSAFISGRMVRYALIPRTMTGVVRYTIMIVRPVLFAVRKKTLFIIVNMNT